jgi:DNA polymerase III subunit chi
MPKIDFYLLQESSTHRFDFACRLIEKAYKHKHRIYVHVENIKDAHALDEKLWTYRDDSFLPHHIHGDGPLPAPPIQIGYAKAPEKERDILLNLSFIIPEFHTQFKRILEVVANDPEQQNIARNNYREYRAKGFDIQTHHLQNGENNP